MGCPLRNELDDIFEREETSWHKKSRLKWVKGGDVNSSSFIRW